jgi:hypothetical protein
VLCLFFYVNPEANFNSYYQHSMETLGENGRENREEGSGEQGAAHGYLPDNQTVMVWKRWEIGK